MITLASHCTECIHSAVCREINEAAKLAEKLKEQGCPYTGKSWERYLADSMVEVTFACQNYCDRKDFTALFTAKKSNVTRDTFSVETVPADKNFDREAAKVGDKSVKNAEFTVL